MKINIGKKYLFTIHGWFLGPDGEQYKAVFGTVNGVVSDSKNTEPNCDSANRFVTIGELTVNSADILTAIRTDEVSFTPPQYTVEYQGEAKVDKAGMSYIYNADS